VFGLNRRETAKETITYVTRCFACALSANIVRAVIHGKPRHSCSIFILKLQGMRRLRWYKLRIEENVDTYFK
jgi:hypothetical protein